MAILKGDVKLVKSVVMDDVPEGGGAPTANTVVDGASNQIFADISEVDRAAGKVSARKVHVWVQSDDTDTYLGGNVIIASPPNDPNVSVTLMSTGETFDERADVMPRVEAYLAPGTNYPGYLFGNHIAGQAAISILQREEVEPPPIGASLVLTRYTGLANEAVQFVRITAVSLTTRTFTDDQGEFKRVEMLLTISDPLREDFPGFDAMRRDPTVAQMEAKTKVSNTLVADAARYYGVVELTDAAAIGDFSVKGESIFTQLVPSAQIETPIGDARTNQVSTAVVSGGGPVTVSLTLAFSPSQNLFVGGGIAPGTLSISGGAVTLTDSGGKLMNSGTQVGTVDYENGVCTLLAPLFGGATTFDVTYSPAAVPSTVSYTQGFKVTLEGRALSYSRTLNPVPVAGTLSVSYMVNRRWYVLRDDGSGAIRGSSTAYGSGTLNMTTGTVLLTLGALPDVGSQVIFQWSKSGAAVAGTAIEPENGKRVFWPINSDGEVSLTPGSKAFAPGTIEITWIDPVSGTTTAVDDNGALVIESGTFANVGRVDYSNGLLYFSPVVLPAKGSTVTVSTQVKVRLSSTVAMSAGSGSLGATNIAPGSVKINVDVQIRSTFNGVKSASSWSLPILGIGSVVDWGDPQEAVIEDDGTGTLYLARLGGVEIAGAPAAGTINYTAGTFTLSPVTLSAADADRWAQWDVVRVSVNDLTLVFGF